MEFKRGIWSFIKSLTIAVVTPVFVFFITGLFTENIWIATGVAALIFIFLIYMTIFSENIKFVVDGEKLEYYKRKRLETYNLKECVVGYRAKTTNGSADHLYLEILNKKTKESKDIDCTALGLNKFYKMYDLIEAASANKATKMETKKKGK